MRYSFTTVSDENTKKQNFAITQEHMHLVKVIFARQPSRHLPAQS